MKMHSLDLNRHVSIESYWAVSPRGFLVTAESAIVDYWSAQLRWWGWYVQGERFEQCFSMVAALFYKGIVHLHSILEIHATAQRSLQVWDFRLYLIPLNVKDQFSVYWGVLQKAVVTHDRTVSNESTCPEAQAFVSLDDQFIFWSSSLYPPTTYSGPVGNKHTTEEHMA